MNATIVDEIRRLLPARLQKASVDAAGRLLLEVYARVDDTHGDKRFVTIEPAGGAVALLVARPTRGGGEHDAPGSSAPPAIQGLVRKELLPGGLVAVDETSLTIARADGKERVLALEATRVVVCARVDDPPGALRVLGVLGAQSQKGDARDLRRGRLYEAPPAPASPGHGQAPVPEQALASSPQRALLAPRVDAAVLALRVRLRAEKKRLKRLLAALAHDLDKHGDASAHERDGELLKTALGRIARGDASVDVVDWEGQPRTLALDPTLDAKDNLARFFRRAKKAREAAARTRPRGDDAERALALVDAAIHEVTSTDAPDAAAIARAERVLAAPSSGGSARRRAAKAGKRQPWRAFRCSGDVIVRVGRGARDNDALVKSARGHDLWLHARNQTGAHVVIPATASDVEPELVLDAAHLAAHFSAARGEPRVDVQHARVKNVKKPGPGAPAGLVHVSHETVLHLRVDLDRLARLLAAEVPAA